MNVVLAKIVDEALNATHKDQVLQQKLRAKRIRKMTPILKSIFKELDSEAKSAVSFNELTALDVSTMPEEIQACLELSSVAELFDILDIDGSGLVTEEEFIEGIMNFCVLGAPVETVQILKLIKMLRAKVHQISADI